MLHCNIMYRFTFKKFIQLSFSNHSKTHLSNEKCKGYTKPYKNIIVCYNFINICVVFRREKKFFEVFYNF